MTTGHKLTELYIRRNRLESLDELQHLVELQHLKVCSDLGLSLLHSWSNFWTLPWMIDYFPGTYTNNSKVTVIMMIVCNVLECQQVSVSKMAKT